MLLTLVTGGWSMQVIIASDHSIISHFDRTHTHSLSLSLSLSLSQSAWLVCITFSPLPAKLCGFAWKLKELYCACEITQYKLETSEKKLPTCLNMFWPNSSKKWTYWEDIKSHIFLFNQSTKKNDAPNVFMLKLQNILR